LAASTEDSDYSEFKNYFSDGEDKATSLYYPSVCSFKVFFPTTASYNDLLYIQAGLVSNARLYVSYGSEWGNTTVNSQIKSYKTFQAIFPSILFITIVPTDSKSAFGIKQQAKWLFKIWYESKYVQGEELLPYVALLEK
jgi:hypothetical protein